MVEPEFPTTVEGLGLEWFAERLGLGRGESITEMASEPVGVGIGVLGLLWRVRLGYRPAGAGPESVVVKLPHPAGPTRQMCDAARFHHREVGAYRDVSRRSPLVMPHCYYAALDEATGDYVLILEDLGGRRTVDQLEGCAPGDAETAVDVVAAHHAALWGDAELAGMAWVPKMNDPPNPEALAAALEASWPVIESDFSDLLPGPMMGVARTLPGAVGELMAAISEAPRTLLHGDYRLDNFYFAVEPDQAPVVVGDWQITGLGRGPYDVAYFLSQSLRPEVRRAEEQRLLHRYHDILLARGVVGYGWDSCVEDYRRAALFCLAYPLVAGAVALANDRSVTLFGTLLERAVAAVVDLDAAELMPTGGPRA